jgi:hypothetical protein
MIRVVSLWEASRNSRSKHTVSEVKKISVHIFCVFTYFAV